jgi:hypothetical protein
MASPALVMTVEKMQADCLVALFRDANIGRMMAQVDGGTEALQ